MSSVCYWFTILQLLLPVLCILLFCRYALRYGLAWAGLAGIALYQVILYVAIVSLGSLGSLHPEQCRLVLLALSGVVVLGAVCGVRPLLILITRMRYRPQRCDLLLVCAGALCLNLWVVQLFGAWRIGPFEYDAISYHIPRAYIWSWQGNFHGWTTANWQQVGSALGGAVTTLPSVFLGCGHVTFSWSQTWYALGAGLGVFVIGRSLGLLPRACWIAMLAFLSFPTLSLRVYGVNSDIAAAFPLVAAVAMFFSVQRVERKVFVAIVLAGLGIACKQYILFPACALGIVLYLVYRRTLSDKKVLWSALVGTCVAVCLILSSYYPVYESFGDFVGGPAGRAHSSIGEGWGGMRRSFAYQIISWLSEPLSFFASPAVKERWFTAFGFGSLYEMFGIPGGLELMPSFNGNEIRSGFLPLAALPILVFGVRRGYRWLAFVGFLIFVFIQVSPLAVIATGRFVIIPLVAFALLWGARAQAYPVSVALCVVMALWCTRQKVAISRWWPNTSLELKYSELECRDLAQIVGGQKLLLLTRSLAADAFVIGRYGSVSFEYVSCPADGDWGRLLREIKAESTWFAMFPDATMVPGPAYTSLLGPSCEGKAITLEQIKEWLNSAGWKFFAKLGCGYELYRHDAV